MTVLTYRAENVSQTNAGGGRMINTLMDGRGGFKPVTPSLQTSGVTEKQKHFIKIASEANTAMVEALVYLPESTASSDTRGYFIPGTQRDTIATMGTRKYATGVLVDNESAGSTSIRIQFETGSGADLVIQNGDSVFISDGVNEDFDLTVSAAVTWAGDIATVTLAAGLVNGYSAGAWAGSVYVTENDINPTYSNLTDDFTDVVFDDVTYPIELESLATIEETITLTFLTANSFSVISDKRGALANGSTLTDYAPVNSDWSLPYFRLRSSAWSGVGVANEVMSFQVHPAAIPVWVVKIVSAGAAAGTDVYKVDARVRY